MRARRFHGAVAYGAMIAVAVVGFLLIRAHGETLVAPAAPAPLPLAAVVHPGQDVLRHLLVALTAVIVTGQLLAKAFAAVGQPPVIGEVVAGILLGPSLLGPDVSALVLPPSAAPVLGGIAQLGVVLYMFLVGLEVNAAQLGRRARAMIAISHASLAAPFLLGAGLALLLYPRLASAAVPFTHFALFMGVAMSITALPVLARIIADRGLAGTEMGALAIGCAAIGDVTAWCLLALVVGIVQTGIGDGVRVAALALAYIGAMWVVVRPAMRGLAGRWEGDALGRGPAAVVFAALLLSALTTEAIGIHAIFGAFLLGAVIPHESAVARTFTRQLEHVVTIVLLPAFFAFTGMRTRIDTLTTSGEWLLCGLVILVATVGKVGGTMTVARVTGLGWRQAATLGTLMNTRGLMELIVLNVGLDLGVISGPLFAMLVVMALVTTLATAPVLRLLGGTR